MDTKIIDLYKVGPWTHPKGAYSINSKVILLNNWHRHRLTDCFTIYEKLDFDNHSFGKPKLKKNITLKVDKIQNRITEGKKEA